MLKRLFDIIFSISVLIFFSPILILVALWVKWDSKGPVFFRQYRVGLKGKEFLIYKFRSMVCNSDNDDSQLTIGSDYRITKSGVFLRKYKIDEFAQFINVLKGDMSVVGPRPEIPQYVALYPSAIREIVSSVRPGITDRASIEFRNESEILGESSNPEEVYVEQVLPIKISYYVDYVEKNSFFGDLKIILSTLKVIFVR